MGKKSLGNYLLSHKHLVLSIALPILAVSATILIFALFYSPKPPLEPLLRKPYVLVYGRNSCGYTARTAQLLSKEGIPFGFRSVDKVAEANVLHDRMRRAGHSVRRYGLPVIDVNGHLFIRPSIKKIQQVLSSED